MAFHLPPPSSAAGNASSESSSNPQYTPVSHGSEEDEIDTSDYDPSRPKQSPVGPLRLQTDFGGSGAGVSGPVSDLEDEHGLGSGDESEDKSGRALRSGSRPKAGPKYSPEEEREVVRLFDRRLVPFLALLYLLAFLDRSSMLFLSSKPFVGCYGGS